MLTRIELYQRYISNASQIEYLEQLGVDSRKLMQYRYRRINPRLDEVERIIEIPNNPDECEVLFYSGEVICVKSNFDELCVRFNDLENSNIEDEDEINLS